MPAPRRTARVDMDLAVEGITCAGCIGEIEARARSTCPASPTRGSTSPTAGCTSPGRDGVARAAAIVERAAAASAIAPIRSRRARRGARRRPRPRRLLRCLARRRLRGHEHHAAVGVGLVRQRHRHHAGDARFLPLALGADRAAGGGLCRPAVLPQRLRARCARAASTWTCRSRSASCSRSACRSSRPPTTPSTPISIRAIMLLFFLLCGRYLDHAMRRKTRAVAGNLAALRAETAHRIDADGELRRACRSRRSRPATACWCGRASACRPTASCVGGSSEIDDSLVTGETAPRAVAAGATVYAGSLNFSGALTLRVTAAGGGTLLDEIERLLDKAAEREVALSSGSPTAPRASMRRSCTSTAALTRSAGCRRRAPCTTRVVTAIAVLIITCPCALALAVPAVQVVAAGRAVPRRRAAQCRRRHRAAGRGRHGRVRQDRHADAAGAARRQCRRDRSRAAANGGAAGAVEPPSAGARRSPREAPATHAVRRRDRGAGAGRARRRSTASRRGSAAPPSAASTRCRRPRDRGAFDHRFPSRRARRRVFAIRQTLRPGCGRGGRGAARRSGLDLHILSGDRAEAVRAGRARRSASTHWHGELKPADKIARSRR